MGVYTGCDASTNVVGTSQTIEALVAAAGITAFYTNNLSAGLSTAQRSFLQRADPTTGVTPTAQLPEELNTRATTPQTIDEVAWVTAPTLLGNPIIIFTHVSSSSALMRFWHVPNFRYPLKIAIVTPGNNAAEFLSVVTSAGSATSYITNPTWMEPEYGRDYMGGRRIATRGRESGYWNFYSSGHSRLTGSGGSACGTNQCIQAFNPIQPLDWQDTTANFWNINLYGATGTTFAGDFTLGVTTGATFSGPVTLLGSFTIPEHNTFTPSGALTLLGSLTLPEHNTFVVSSASTFIGTFTLSESNTIRFDVASPVTSTLDLPIRIGYEPMTATIQTGGDS